MPIGHIDPTRKNVHVVGAGFAGLTLAKRLKQKGHRVFVWEAAPVAGGKLQTLQTPYGLVEQAANAIFTNDDVWAELEELELQSVSPTPKLKRLVWRGKATSFPLSFGELVKIFVRLFRKVPNNIDGMSVADFFIPLLGRVVVDEVVTPGLRGIYASTADELALKALFPSVKPGKSYWSTFRRMRKKQKRPKESLNFSQGITELLEKLKTFPDELHFKSEITSQQIETWLKTDNVCLCTDAHQAANLLDKFSAIHDLRSKLSRVHYLRLSSTTFFFHRRLTSLEGSFGILFPPNEKALNSKGILANTEIFPHFSNQYFSYTCIADENVGPADLIEDFKNLEQAPEIEQTIAKFYRKSWKKAIPRYDDSIVELQSLKSKELPIKGLVLFGNYTDGISLRQMLSASRRFSEDNGSGL